MKGRVILKGIINKNDINIEERTFGAFASVSIVDRQGDLIEMAEFRPALEKLMSSGRIIPISDSHTNHICGTVLSYSFKIEPHSGKEGLYITAKIYNDYDTETIIWNKIKEGAYTGISLGGRAGDKKQVCDESQCYNILTDIEIWELSIVEIPANNLSLIDSVNKLAKSLKFSKDDAKKIGNKLKIDWNEISEDEFLRGLEIELEHGTKNPSTNITDDDEEMTAKIALAHLLEFPDYYSKSRGLPKLEDDLKKLYKNPILKYIQQSKVLKARAYVKKPNDAPPGVKVYIGSEGGHYYNTEDNYGKASPHSKVRLKRSSDAPKGVKVREDMDGFYYDSDDL